MTTYLNPAKFKAYGNSGAGCVSLALFGDAARVIMLGFDCQHTGGQAHWHGNHPRGLANAKQIDRWPKLFEQLKNDHPEAEILNASRETALTCFERVALEDVL
jgi:hypothetical protein